MSSTESENSRALLELIRSTQALLTQFTTSLNPTESSLNAQPTSNALHPLHILRDAAKLLKAHTTKLSLLAINDPFTPTAVTKVLREISSTCLPAMMSAAQICRQEKTTWGSFMGTEVQTRVRRAFREVEVLLKELQTIAEGQKSETTKRDNLNATGVVWEACDALVELEQLGIPGLAVEKAEQYRDTIKDAIAELQEWREAGDAKGDGDELLDSDDEGVAGDADSIDEIFGAANSMPNNCPEVRVVVESAEAKLKKAVLLYTALIKRRLKTYKASDPSNDSASSNVEKLDTIMDHLKRVPHEVDEMASYLYDLDEDTAKSTLEKCIGEARKANKTASMDWTCKEDEFTAWSLKWEEAIG